MKHNVGGASSPHRPARDELFLSVARLVHTFSVRDTTGPHKIQDSGTSVAPTMAEAEHER